MLHHLPIQLASLEHQVHLSFYTHTFLEETVYHILKLSSHAQFDLKPL